MCKTSLIKYKSWLVETFFDYGKVITLSLLKMNSPDNKSASIETIKISISKSGAKT